MLFEAPTTERPRLKRLFELICAAILALAAWAILIEPDRLVVNETRIELPSWPALPLLGRPIVPSKFGERFASGHIIEEGRHLFVTTGIGVSILPVRFGVPPEIAMLTLDSGNGATN